MATNVSSAAPKVLAAALEVALLPKKQICRCRGSGRSGSTAVAVEAATGAASASTVAGVLAASTEIEVGAVVRGGQVILIHLSS